MALGQFMEPSYQEYYTPKPTLLSLGHLNSRETVSSVSERTQAYRHLQFWTLKRKSGSRAGTIENSLQWLTVAQASSLWGLRLARTNPHRLNRLRKK